MFNTGPILEIILKDFLSGLKSSVDAQKKG